MKSNVEDRERIAQDSRAPFDHKVLIAVPFYENEALVESVVGSLIACAADIAAIEAEVLLLNDSPDYVPLRVALEAILPRALSVFPCRIVTNPINLGFVRTMNRAISKAVRSKQDILLLNSDTVVYAGALPEMVRVASLDAMIAFVNPRSDNATLATLPVAHRRPLRETGFNIAPYRALAARLPEITYVPTAVGFCMLIRWQILAEFAGFDEIFGAGYNEENDLVMRAGRCGYRAVLANRAFVRHEGEKSFGAADQTKLVLEKKNRAILDRRYPEYGSLVSAYFDSPEAIAETLLSTLIPDETGKLNLAFDFSHFSALHTGTTKAGWQLMKSAADSWSERFNLYVLCSGEVYDFHAYANLGIARREPHGPEKFAVIFRVGQTSDWNAIERLVLKAAVIGIYMLDTIALDCTQLTSTHLYNIWQFALAHADFIVTPSAQSLQQFTMRFHIPKRVARIPALHSLDIEDYKEGGVRCDSKEHESHPIVLLVIGNHFPHKYLVPTANVLAEAFPDRKVVALGQAKPEISEPFNPYNLPHLHASANLTGVNLGQLTDAEMVGYYRDAEIVIFPSHYEGFGFPVLNALAAERPVFVRKLPVFEELYRELGQNPNIHFYETTSELVAGLETVPPWQGPQISPQPDIGAERSAKQIFAQVEAALPGTTYRVIVERIRAIQNVAGAPAATSPFHLKIAHDTSMNLAASFAASRVEWVLQRVFRFPPVYFATRVFFRMVRPVLRGLLLATRALRAGNRGNGRG